MAKNESRQDIEKFLKFLADDVETHPERLCPFPADLITRARALTNGVQHGLEAPLPPD